MGNSGSKNSVADASAYVVMAEFEVKQASFLDFVSLARHFSTQCLEHEAGCRRFDVVLLDTTPFGVLFYEVYDSFTAFETHCRSGHLAGFKLAFPQLVVGERQLRKGTT